MVKKIMEKDFVLILGRLNEESKTAIDTLVAFSGCVSLFFPDAIEYAYSSDFEVSIPRLIAIIDLIENLSEHLESAIKILVNNAQFKVLRINPDARSSALHESPELSTIATFLKNLKTIQ